MLTITRKRNDTLPIIRLQCLDVNGDEVDLTGATALRFIVQDNTGSVVIDGTAEADADQVNNTGWWEYTPQTGDFDTAGRFNFELEVTFTDGVQTFPTKEFGRLIIKGDLG